jgi:hypothetical protein
MALARRRLSVYQLALPALFLGAAVALIPRIALTLYAFPSTDDYCIVAETRDDGFWYMQVHSYLTWTGRYSAVFLESIISQFDLIAGYPWFALLTLLLTLAAIRALMASVIGDKVSRLRVTIVALAAAAVFIGGLPSTVEAFYWMPGAASYTWGIIAYLAWLSLLIRRARRDDAGNLPKWQTLSIVILAAILPGFNEVSAPIVLATIAAFIAGEWLRGRAADRFLLKLLGIIVVLTAVCFVAPGNGNRSSGYPGLASRHNLAYALVETARQTARFIVNFGSYPALWLGAFAASWWSARTFPGACAWMRRPAHAAIVLLGLVSIIYLTLFPLYWEYGEMNFTGEGRTYNVTFVVLCAIVLVVTGVIARTLAGTRGLLPWDEARDATVVLAGAGLVAALLMVSPSTRHVFEALRVAPVYLKEEQARARDLRRTPPDGIAFVDRISVKPAGLFWGDVELDESHWINVCVAKYYRLRSVRARM